MPCLDSPQYEKQQLEALFTLSDSATVRAQVAEAERGGFLSDNEYESSMKAFFAQELGLEGQEP